MTRAADYYTNIDMIGFFLKKNFYDGWDNLFLLAGINIIIVFLFIGIFYAASLMIAQAWLFTAILLISCPLLFILIFAFGKCAVLIANYKSVTFKEYFSYTKDVWRDALLFGLICDMLVLFASISIPFYIQMGTIIGTFLSALSFWILLIAFLSFQWFIPLRYLLPEDSFIKTLKKCFIVFFDNTGFSIFMFFYTSVLWILSLAVFFIVPSVCGVVLAHTNALRLRLYKYDWIEEHPELTPKQARAQIPWEELIADDRETVGPRTLKNLIFPWK